MACITSDIRTPDRYKADLGSEHVKSCRELIEFLKSKLAERREFMRQLHTETGCRETPAKKLVDPLQDQPTPKTHDSSNECTAATPKVRHCRLNQPLIHCRAKSSYPFTIENNTSGTEDEYGNSKVVKTKRKSVFDIEIEGLSKESESLDEETPLPDDNARDCESKDEEEKEGGILGKLDEYVEECATFEQSLHQYNDINHFMTEAQTQQFSIQCYLLKRQVEMFRENYNQVFNKDSNANNSYEKEESEVSFISIF
eukprot:TRINITY_DN889_c0_g1_i5.p1 TRINITY_DN889_c0_g1~~TRINITY_DN889_c0_g1_i5.p1  ORF type:complete len:256 (+),score=33.08 TRINITY_DN889_c0_g1_i5:145-912(+)